MFKTLIILLLFPILVNAQDKEYVRKIIDTLSSSSFEGRGYVNNGDRKAADYISLEFARLELNKYNLDYKQEFKITINTLPSQIDVVIGKKNLTPGTSFMVSASSPTIKGTFPIVRLNSKIFDDEKKFDKFCSKNLREKFVIVDINDSKRKNKDEILKKIKYLNFLNSKGVIFIKEGKLSWGISNGQNVSKYITIDVLRDSLPKKTKLISVNIKNKFYDLYQTQNLASYISGTIQPDTFIVFTAHYDHLGRMGNKVYFPGANDNASGTAAILDLARHFNTKGNKPYYSIVFLAFTGEEAGLLGSEYFASHPLFKLKNIKALINLDMIGSGSEGITVVNGDTMHDIFNKLIKINEAKQYFPLIKKRGQSCNSDHCPFFEKGVPSIFIYTMGSEFSEYHNIYDVSKKLPLTKYNELFQLLIDFVANENPK